MKVISATKMAAMEKQAIEQGSDSEAFMLKAAAGIAYVIDAYIEKSQSDKKITLYAGKGNNGGDAYCAALILLEKGYEVTAYQLYPFAESSELCQKYGHAFEQAQGQIIDLNTVDEIEEASSGIILDGLLGTGFKGQPTDELQNAFELINNQTAPVFSIDIPSGLSGDSGRVEGTAVCADYTLFLGLPKTGFFLEDGWDYIGKLIYLDFGIDEQYIEKVSPDFEMITISDCISSMPPIRPSRHKYEAGYVAGFSGSPAMAGASILSGAGALKSGCGIVKMIHLDQAAAHSSYYPELIHQSYDFEQVEEINAYIEKANAIYLGPGLGLSDKMQHFVAHFLEQVSKPCIIDADAINIMALKKIKPPKGSILTPHTGEAARLLDLKQPKSQELMDACQKYVDLHDVVLILKGGPTFIFSKDAPPTISIVGDPGMATAGSGDVLTGILAGLAAQINDMKQVAKLGTFLHGKAGELAADKKTSYCMVATDILKALHHAWKFLLDPMAST